MFAGHWGRHFSMKILIMKRQRKIRNACESIWEIIGRAEKPEWILWWWWKSALCLGRFLHISGTKRIKEVFYRQHIDNHKSYCYSRYNISGKQFLNRSVIWFPCMKKEMIGGTENRIFNKKAPFLHKGKEYAYGKGGYSHQSLYEKK